MINTIEINKNIINISKLDLELRTDSITKTQYQYVTKKGELLILAFSGSLSQNLVNKASQIVNNFIEIDIGQQLKEYVQKTIAPFIEDLMYQIQAENIQMGITQAGKTSDVVSFFTEKFVLPGKTRGVSMKATLDSNSLNVTIDLMTYLISNPELYSDLNPFITADRLSAWRSKIITKLMQG